METYEDVFYCPMQWQATWS